ncbi:MarC family protein [Thiothrix eikelboomii]|uniref:MarC family protein n=1 Tax=Thiothrix eikelboomii TaxID=92487 RepID=UPI003BB21BC5
MDVATFLTAFTGLFVIIDPIGTALIFNSMVPANDTRYINTMAIKATLISAILLVGFGLYGEPFLQHLGININSVRIAGGLLLFYTAFGMITHEVETPTESKKTDISVYPLSIPLIAGPGALTLVILLFAQASSVTSDLAVFAAIISVLLLNMLFMMLSKHLQRIIGHTGDEILRRFLGVILAALAVQFVYDGIKNLSSSF